MKTTPVSRREFLRRSTLTAGLGLAAGAAPNLFLSTIKAATGENPTEFIRVGFIATGGQGMANMNALLKNAVAVCDVDQKHLANGARRVEQSNAGRKCATYTDYRHMLESKDVDAVVVSTPDHWHALPAIHACQAGKDVYVEKPLTLTIEEGQALVKVARQTGRIVQTGSQQRSETRFRRGCELVRNGHAGKIKEVRVGLPGVNWTKDPLTPDSEPPAELDYDLWLGPAPYRPYNQQRIHYFFRFFWDYSGGQMTNWGAHHLDIAQWGLGMDASGPVEISATARFDPDKRFETPNYFAITYQYANGVTVFCESPARRTGTTFIGDQGTIHVNRGVLETTPEDIADRPVKEGDLKLYVSRQHHQNWLECIKTRKPPICSAEVGHRSATVCHLGNIAVRTGKTVKWDPVNEVVVGDAELAQWAGKPYREPWKLPI